MGDAGQALDHKDFCKPFHDQETTGPGISCFCDTSQIWNRLDYIRDWESDIRVSGTVLRRHRCRFSKAPALFALAKLNYVLHLSRVQQEERSKRIGGPLEFTNRVSPAFLEQILDRGGRTITFCMMERDCSTTTFLNDRLVTASKNINRDNGECAQSALSAVITGKRFSNCFTSTKPEHLRGDVDEVSKQSPLSSGFAYPCLCTNWTAFDTSQDADCSEGENLDVGSDMVWSNPDRRGILFDIKSLMTRCNHSSTKHDVETYEDDKYVSAWRLGNPFLDNFDEHWVRRYYSLLRYRKKYVVQSFYCQHQAYILRSLFNMLSYFLHPDQYHDFSALDRIKVIEHIGLILELVCEIYNDRIATLHESQPSKYRLATKPYEQRSRVHFGRLCRAKRTESFCLLFNEGGTRKGG